MIPTVNPMSLDGRVVLVTGASSGIGQDIAVLLSQLGAKVILVGRNEERLNATLSQLNGEGHLVSAFDLQELEQIPAWLKALSGKVGQISGLVHSAGLGFILPVRATSLAKFHELMNVNVSAGFMLAKAFRQPGVRAPRASVVYISSIMGAVAQPAHTAYCTSKAALLGLTRSLAIELAREDIRVNCVMPGSLDAGMGATPDAVGSENHAELVRKHPLGLGTTRDVSNAVAFMLADTARWITGASLLVDGGYTAL